jgi:hypothetical protein
MVARFSVQDDSYSRCPQRRHWELLKVMQSAGMTPAVFLHFWDISHKDLSKICMVSESTVHRWFCRTENTHREPSKTNLLFLYQVNKAWVELDSKQRFN